MPGMLKEKILQVEKIAPVIFKMTIESAYIANTALPGQFANVRCSEGNNVLLRRPISICNVDRYKNTFDLIFQIRGTGTELLSRMQPGESVDLLGPLGNSFDLDEKYSKIAVIGGGIGIFPLLFLLNESRAGLKQCYLGFRSREFIVLEEEFKTASHEMRISTDDGSVGYNGLVTDMLAGDIGNNPPDMLYACGPTPMIKNVIKLAEIYGIPSQVSMEQRMGCGIGACLVCACKTKYGEEWEYSHVCKDGPVFNGGDLIFDE
ncbi:MAG: dihydroorotate dehydrogenase electron transfer subunit [Ruminiclostridium sp.]|nr:dihydroorotate dehydrogenase electron transfer subunit [Ruminiclostridium sp.]